MNTVLGNIIDTHCTKFNKNITDGCAKEILKTIPEYLDDIFKSSLKTLSPHINLKYEGYRIPTPEEEFNIALLSNSNKVNYDLSESYVYMVEYIFTYNGNKIVRPLYLPYCEDGNIIKVSSTKYHIVPILSSTVISPSYNKIFVRLLKDKLTFTNKVRNRLVNGNTVYGNVINCEIVKTKKMSNIKDNIGAPLTASALYLLGYRGLKGTFEYYCKLKPDQYVIRYGDTSDLEADYNIHTSIGTKPRSLKDKVYIKHDLAICIRKDVKPSELLNNVISGIIYTMDILPEHAKDLLYVLNKNNLQEEIMYWRVLLGRVVYKNSYSIDRIIEDMNDHFYNLEGYLDNLIRVKLSENKIFVNDFFDLLAVILENYTTWSINSKEYNSNIGNRYIDVLYYILYDIIIGFNKVILNLNKRCSKKGDGNLSIKEIDKLFRGELGLKKIFTIVKTSSPSLVILACDSSLDIKYPKITAILEDYNWSLSA